MCGYANNEVPCDVPLAIWKDCKQMGQGSSRGSEGRKENQENNIGILDSTKTNSLRKEGVMLPKDNLLLPKTIQDKLLRKAKHLEDLKLPKTLLSILLVQRLPMLILLTKTVADYLYGTKGVNNRHVGLIKTKITYR
ncbi:hypothetical protein E3N88_44525 [Mikania micrantha]|uniref:Uncharacterized protein n=1 Tax=Mikania micrantha TaxID=192012 RepID=A0A5N6LC17_9ASTR|nr:hypothetical protein E3N88_44525 [Mikania micrantha]